ncbi:hypothetical protein DVH24_000981 [Malus domestica]|uniref:Uncharacterized protein n=1 Tax=Malus domestica TaxID=3750 RepID=A0A498K055_MALDO|nr:hypothetical protein DVH24_000981 [Malus domestica]
MNSSTPAHALTTHSPLHRFTTAAVAAPCQSSFSCSMPRPPNRNRRTRRNRNTTRPTTTTTTTSTTIKPYFYPPSPSNPDTLQATFDLDYIYHTSHSTLNQFFSDSSDALQDLRTLVSVDAGNRVIVSCRPSTLRFVGNLVIITFSVVLGFRVLVALVRLGFRSQSGYGKEATVVRRDRSLGGKEVVVGRVEKERVDARKRKSFGILDNPLSMPKSRMVDGLGRMLKSQVRWAKKLPSWWPSSAPKQSPVVDKEYYQGEADRLVRVITDNRMSGKDIGEDDIIHVHTLLIRIHHEIFIDFYVDVAVALIQFRSLFVRTSGVRVSFDTTNTRDSFYRVSVEYVLNVCSRAPSHSTYVQIDGEDVCQFIAGLAGNIGLDNIRAARIMCAAVAARTRSRFLQAWALVMQSKHAEALVELSKICLLLRIFPPEESSPEMEMVARGLEKHLKLDQREFLMSMLTGVCSEKSQRRAAEALGLNLDQQFLGLDGEIMDAVCDLRELLAMMMMNNKSSYWVNNHQQVRLCIYICDSVRITHQEETHRREFTAKMVSFEMNDRKKIGLGLTGFGIFFTCLGMAFFFDKGLLAMGNILFLSGVTLTIGFKPTMQFFMKRQNYKGTISFGVGFFFVIIGWPIIGMILEAYGFIVLFSGFWPTLAVFIQKIPVLGWLFQQPYVRSVFDRYRGRRVPV